MHDLIIRNGLVVDGISESPYRADVAVDGNQISKIGVVSEESLQVIDAGDCIVTPGFIDLHTHLDAQIGWDPMLTPLSWHGVTTAILGNCGVTFAPCKPQDREFLASMMETVEDIPRDAILEGLAWNWESYGEYLNALESLSPVINVGGMVGHCAVRFYVMGERGIDEDASAQEIEQIAMAVEEAIKSGAVGFSTSRNPGHRIPDGGSVPGTFATEDELLAIAKVVGQEGGLMQSVMNMSSVDDEMALLKLEASKARVLFSHYTGGTTSFGDKIEAQVDSMRREGLDVSAMVIPRASGFVAGLEVYPPWRGGPWDELLPMAFKDRLKAINDPALTERLIEFARVNEPIVPAEQIYHLGDGEYPDYVSGPEQSLSALAERNVEHPSETFLRMSRASNGKALFTLRALNRNLEAVAKAISADFCLPGLGDAGAHVNQIMDSGWTTFCLGYWCRDRELLSLPEMVKQLTSAPARIVGLSDRGVIKPGAKADLNVIDLDRLSELMPKVVSDFPGGSKRLIQGAIGYRATVCNGVVILENDRHTGVRAGEVLRRK